MDSSGTLIKDINFKLTPPLALTQETQANY